MGDNFIKFNVAVVGIDRNTAYIRGQLSYAAFLVTSAGILPIEDSIKSYVPVDTGALKESIHHEVVVQVTDRCTMVVGPDDTLLPRNSPSHYAEDVEFGTRFQTAQPYVRTGFDAARDAAIAAMADEARVAIREIMANITVDRNIK